MIQALHESELELHRFRHKRIMTAAGGRRLRTVRQNDAARDRQFGAG
jgi:hypothetical protein